MGQYVQLIYNPMAGARLFPTKIDHFLEVFQNKGYEVRIWRTNSPEDFSNYLIGRDLSRCKAVIVAGGDGSVNQVINCMLKNSINIPLGVIPAGTANDFASHIGMPVNFSETFEILSNMNVAEIDVGKANDQYFINVCCGGLFTNVSQNIDIELKNTLGKLAYYIKGVQQLPKFRKVRFKIINEQEEIDDYFLLFLLLNSKGAGGFNKLALEASVQDGYMDFIGLKECSINYIPKLFSKIINGQHLEDPHIVYFKTKRLNIECMEGMEAFEESDLDGEKGPKFPLDIHVYHKRLKVITKGKKKHNRY